MAKNKRLLEEMSPEEGRKFIGPNLSFAAAEAYKKLRTNLMFALPKKNKCRVIGVTSALKGEGKSTTSMNIAYSFAQMGQRVLLVEGDLRLPNIANRLGLHSKPGISNLLVGQCSGNEVLQKSSFLDNVHVITAGDIPPNPAELLTSDQMKQTMAALSQVFDVIILDLPPVTVVTDAQIASSLVDGMVVVVRKDYCDKKAIFETVNQFHFAGTKILGFVFTGADLPKRAYKRYYKKDYESYSHAGKSVNDQKEKTGV